MADVETRNTRWVYAYIPPIGEIALEVDREFDIENPPRGWFHAHRMSIIRKLERPVLNEKGEEVLEPRGNVKTEIRTGATQDILHKESLVKARTRVNGDKVLFYWAPEPDGVRIAEEPFKSAGHQAPPKPKKSLILGATEGDLKRIDAAAGPRG